MEVHGPFQLRYVIQVAVRDIEIGVEEHEDVSVLEYDVSHLTDIDVNDATSRDRSSAGVGVAVTDDPGAFELKLMYSPR